MAGVGDWMFLLEPKHIDSMRDISSFDTYADAHQGLGSLCVCNPSQPPPPRFIAGY